MIHSTSRILLLATLLIFGNTLTAQSVEYSWTAKYEVGPTSEMLPLDGAADADGNVISVGDFYGPIDFDPGPGTLSLTPTSWVGGFITKLDSTGALVFAKSFGGPDSIHAEAVDVDAAGNIWVAGHFGGTVDLDPGPGVVNVTSSSFSEGYVVKLDAAGNYLWSGTLAATMGSYSSVYALDVDETGSVFLTGYLSGTMDADPGTGTSTLTTGYSQYILKLNPSGSFAWASSVPSSSTGTSQGFDIVAEAGQVYSCGIFYGAIDFHPGAPDSTHTSTGSSHNAFVYHCDSSGVYQWVRTMPSTGWVYAHEISISPLTGNLSIAGHFTDTADLNPSPTASSSFLYTSGSSYVLCLDPAGTFQWARQFGTPNMGSYNKTDVTIAMDAAGRHYVGGYFYGTGDFDPGAGLSSLSSPTTYTLYILCLDPSGNYQWVIPTGTSSGSSQAFKLCLDAWDNLFDLGIVGMGADFDPSGGSDLSTALKTSFTRRLRQGACPGFGVTFSGSIDPSCAGPGSGTADPFGGTAPYTYLWASGATTSTASLTSPGLHSVTVTDATGCTATGTLLLGGISPSPGFDLEPFTPWTFVRFSGLSWLYVASVNHNCLPTDGQLQVIMPPGLTVTSSSITPDAVVGDTLKFNFTGLLAGTPGPNPTIEFVNSFYPLGDTLCFEVRMIPSAGDAVPANNSKTICTTVMAAYDPNDKQVYPQGICEEHFTEKSSDLQYTIRFQNTGTAPAVDVYILDTLDADLDPSSLVLKHTSHDCIAELLPGNVLKFRFDGINLPDSSTDFDGSQGHIIFEASPDAGLSDLTVIENRVGIYFDLNPVVLTNTVFNTMVDSIPQCSSLAVPDIAPANAFTLFPNPAHSSVTLHASHPWSQAQLTVLNLHGQTMSNATLPAGNEHSIDLQGLSSGIYFVRISTPQGTETLRLLVE